MVYLSSLPFCSCRPRRVVSPFRREKINLSLFLSPRLRGVVQFVSVVAVAGVHFGLRRHFHHSHTNLKVQLNDGGRRIKAFFILLDAVVVVVVCREKNRFSLLCSRFVAFE